MGQLTEMPRVLMMEVRLALPKETNLALPKEMPKDKSLACLSDGQMATQTVQMKDVLMEMRLVCLSVWLMETAKDS